MKHLMTFLVTLILLGNNNSNLTTLIDDSYAACDAEIIVSNNMASKSLTSSEMIFDMEIKNISSSVQTYTLSTTFLDENCSNKYNPRQEGESNITLDATIMGLSNDNTIDVNPNESQSFQIKLTVPNDVKYNSWACIEVNAKTNSCSTISRPQVLSVYVPNPDED